MNDYNDLIEQIFESIDTIASKKLEKLGYDKTILCSIISVEEAEIGKYQVSDGSTTYYAYSEKTDYEINQQVYVVVPSGDYSQQLTIIGKYNKSSDAVEVSSLKRYAEIKTIFENDLEYGLIAGKGISTTNNITIENNNLNEEEDFDYSDENDSEDKNNTFEIYEITDYEDAEESEIYKEIQDDEKSKIQEIIEAIESEEWESGEVELTVKEEKSEEEKTEEEKFEEQFEEESEDIISTEESEEESGKMDSEEEFEEKIESSETVTGIEQFSVYKYAIKNNNESIFYAYSTNNSYKKNQKVYVKNYIDEDNQNYLMIVGKYDSTDTDSTDTDSTDTDSTDTDSTDTDSTNTDSTDTDSTDTDKKREISYLLPLDSKELIDCSNCNSLLVKASFNSEVGDTISVGSYGLLIILTHDNDEIETFSFDSSCFNGNIYNYQIYNTQSLLFSLDDIDEIKDIQIYFYQGKIEEGYGEDFEGQYHTENDLFVKDIKISIGNYFSNITSSEAFLVSNSGDSFSEIGSEINLETSFVYLNDDNSITYIYSEDDDYIENLDNLMPECQIRFYRKDSNSSYTDTYIGSGWSLLSIQKDLLTFSELVSENMTKNTELIYKVIYIYTDSDGKIYSYPSNEITFKNNNSNALKQIDKETALTLTCENNGIFNIYKNSNNECFYTNKTYTITMSFNSILEEYSNINAINITSNGGTIEWTWDGSSNGKTMIASLVKDSSASYKAIITPKQYYSDQACNNIITCKVSFDGGITYKKDFPLTFGKIDSQGLNYNYHIDLGKNFTTLACGEIITATAKIYDTENGYSAVSTSIPTEFFWYNNSISTSSFITDDIMHSTIAISTIIETTEETTEETTVYSPTRNISFNGEFSTSLRPILGAISTIDGYVLYDYKPIPISNTLINSYNQSGKIAYSMYGFSNEEIYEEIKINDKATGFMSTILCADGQQNNAPTIIEIPDSNGKKRIKPSSLKPSNEKEVQAAIYSTSDNFKILCPIYMEYNKYQNNYLNSWNGNGVSIDEAGAVLSNMMAAGKKESDNTFTGIQLGILSTTTGLSSSTDYNTDNLIGLYGLSSGTPSFGFREDGTAFIGQNGGIQLNGKEASIYSKDNSDGNQVGIFMDLNKSVLKVNQGYTITDKNNVNSTASATVFQIDNRGDKGGSYFLRSANYEEGISGSYINLITGEYEFNYTGGNGTKASVQNKENEIISLTTVAEYDLQYLTTATSISTESRPISTNTVTINEYTYSLSTSTEGTVEDILLGDLNKITANSELKIYNSSIDDYLKNSEKVSTDTITYEDLKNISVITTINIPEESTFYLKLTGSTNQKTIKQINDTTNFLTNVNLSATNSGIISFYAHPNNN